MSATSACRRLMTNSLYCQIQLVSLSSLVNSLTIKFEKFQYSNYATVRISSTEITVF